MMFFKKFSPDSAREGSFGGFYVKVQMIYYTDKQLVRKILNIPNLMMYVSINCYNISFKIVSVNVRQISSFTFL